MKQFNRWRRFMGHVFLILFVLLFIYKANAENERHTSVSIQGNKFYINNIPTYKNVFWQANSIEGLLFNSRMVQGIFDDENSNTRSLFAYPDTGVWDADRNTQEFIDAMASWKAKGLLAFTLNLQGGSPTGYGNKGWINSAFKPNGSLKQAYLHRLEKILDHADQLGMVVILGYFYFGQDEIFKNEAAVIRATDGITDWLMKKGYRNLLIEINNEADIYYDHAILQAPKVHELIERVRHRSQHQFLVSTSFSGGVQPTDAVIQASDFILLHANDVKSPAGVVKLIRNVKQSAQFRGQPIVVNEDDHFNFSDSYNHFTVSLREYVSWGYFDYRMKDEAFNDGFQSMPANWKISSPRKQDFFNLLEKITVGDQPSRSQAEYLKRYIGTWYSTDALSDKAIGKNPFIKMHVTPALSGQSIQVMVYRLEENQWREMLVELISYDHPSNQIVASGQNDQGVAFVGKGYFVDENTWYMKDTNHKGDFTLNVLFQFQDHQTVVLHGIGDTPENSWSVKYIKTKE